MAPSEGTFSISGWSSQYAFMVASALASPVRRHLVVPKALDLTASKGRWVGGVRVPAAAMGPSSLTFSLLSPTARLEHTLAEAEHQQTVPAAAINPFFGIRQQQQQPESSSSSRLWTPVQSGRSSSSHPGAIHVTEGLAGSGLGCDDFQFECGNAVPVKPWQGERIHEECGGEIASDELELTLGNSRQRST